MINDITPASALVAGGGSVTISGVDLGSGTDITQVLFGSVTATIVSQSSTQIVVTLPAAQAAGAVTVTVASTSRGTSVREGGFTYFGMYRPQLWSVLAVI